MPIEDYAHWNEEAQRVWWEEEGKHPYEPPYCDMCGGMHDDGRCQSWEDEDYEALDEELDDEPDEYCAICGETDHTEKECPVGQDTQWWQNLLTTLKTSDEPVIVTRPETPEVKFVNVYEMFREYGGPEEGGWWYDRGELIVVIRCAANEAADVRDQLRSYFPTQTGSSRGYCGVTYTGGDYRTEISDTPGQSYPAERPHYE
jgi:hypothetical protein